MKMTDAQALFGKSFIGPSELSALAGPLTFPEISVPDIHFGDVTLKACAQTHVLLFAPQSDAKGNVITLNYVRELFGMDPSVSEPCMYNQDWYLKEDFAAVTTLDGAWHLLPKSVREEDRAKRPYEIEAGLTEHEGFPTAVVCAFAFFAYWFVSGGERLWDNDFLWCSDRDHNNDRIYVGRYTDPTGVNKNGFNIHRHLALRPSYSAAPEIIS